MTEVVLNKSNAKYILFRGIEAGNTFFSMNNILESEEDACKLNTGETAYRIIGYANTAYDAQVKLGISEYFRTEDKLS